MSKKIDLYGWEKYIEDVKSGKIVTCIYIKQLVARFEKMCSKPEYYFDRDAVIDCIEFIGTMKHFLGKAAGQYFVLQDWQQFMIAYIVGLKYKESGLRVVRNVYLQIARKAGKSSLIAALALYMLIADGEASPEIACLATSREQANLLFNMMTNYAKTIDRDGKVINYYKNYMHTEFNNGQCKVYSSDSARLDGLNISVGILDEYAAQRDNLLYSVIKSSMAYREQPLLICITTPQFSLTSPAYQTYKTGIEILAEVKEDDSFLPILYTLDPEDKWDDENVWIKSNPGLNVTVTKDWIRGEVKSAKNDSTQEVPVKIKTIGIWVSSQNCWIPQEVFVKSMDKVDLKDYEGYNCSIGVDLSSVNDMTSLAVFIPTPEKKYIFKTWSWIPNDTYENSPQRELYRKFIQEGSLVLTEGNVVDYDVVLAKIGEISQILTIDAIYYDKWNATQFAIEATSAGFNMVEFSQAIGNYNACFKELTKSILDGNKCVIDKSYNVLWQSGNVVIKQDINGNQKPTKEQYKNKIDAIIAMCTALGGWLKAGANQDIDIFVL